MCPAGRLPQVVPILLGIVIGRDPRSEYGSQEHDAGHDLFLAKVRAASSHRLRGLAIRHGVATCTGVVDDVTCYPLSHLRPNLTRGSSML
jgi:hypothetical protein